MSPELPDAAYLTRAVYSGWACVVCGESLAQGGVLAGRALGHVGAFRLDVDVYRCRPGRGCAATTQTASTAEGHC
ncbi:hypothetical protein GCM10010216_49150 [Streptomyces flaveolus]|nr:hypothetical protein GCM10010216_49150 [Streptomyces flaveolus]